MNIEEAQAGVERLLGAVTTELSDLLGRGLLGLYVHGSWINGDFAPARSDLDLLAVLNEEPRQGLLVDLEQVHARLAAAFPRWDGRLEVEYVALQTIRAVAESRGGGEIKGSATIARISPGEPLHLLPATGHRVLTWALVREDGRPLAGPAARELLPAFDSAVVRDALRLHVRDWPRWVTQMDLPGGQAYAVLTLCRALHLAREGQQVSKRRAAGYAAASLPQWSTLIEWASDWWYRDGSDQAPSRLEETVAFVDAVSASILGE